MNTDHLTERDVIIEWLIAKAEQMETSKLDLMRYGGFALMVAAAEIARGAHLVDKPGSAP